jgi:hypothetical protein
MVQMQNNMDICAFGPQCFSSSVPLQFVYHFGAIIICTYDNTAVLRGTKTSERIGFGIDSVTGYGIFKGRAEMTLR